MNDATTRAQRIQDARELIKNGSAQIERASAILIDVEETGTMSFPELAAIVTVAMPAAEKLDRMHAQLAAQLPAGIRPEVKHEAKFCGQTDGS